MCLGDSTTSIVRIEIVHPKFVWYSWSGVNRYLVANYLEICKSREETNFALCTREIQTCTSPVHRKIVRISYFFRFVNRKLSSGILPCGKQTIFTETRDTMDRVKFRTEHYLLHLLSGKISMTDSSTIRLHYADEDDTCACK